MKKIIGFIIFFAILLTSFSSCTGYNQIMYNHLSNPDNYRTFEAVIVDLFYQNSNRDIVRNFESTEFLEYEVVIYIEFESYEDISVFLGGNANTAIPVEDFEISLEISVDNSNILYENGFYKDIAMGDIINVTSSSWIYMDANFFYVAHIERNGVVYLDFESGLENIVDMMNKNKSIF